MNNSLRRHLQQTKYISNRKSNWCCTIIITFKLRGYHLIIIIILLFCITLWIDSVVQWTSPTATRYQYSIKIDQNQNNTDNVDESIKIESIKDTTAYLRSYDSWIKGLGQTKLLNDDPNSNCIYPSVPFLLTNDQTFNSDILYNEDHKGKMSQFSTVYNRIVTIQCGSKTGDNKVFYLESDTIYNDGPKAATSSWQTLENQNGSYLFVLHLQNNTQSIWIRCMTKYNFHITLLPLTELNPSLFAEKTRKIIHNFGTERLPPNIVIFVIDSASRSSFIRSAPLSVDYLSSLLYNSDRSPVDILQFFRYSTVGWGTGVNLNALISGVCFTKQCVNADWSNCVGLAAFYDKLGYFVPGYNAKGEVQKKTEWQSDTGCDFYLSENVVTKAYGIIYRYDIEVFINDIALPAINKLQKDYDRKIPYFMILHGQSNHVQSSKSRMFTLDKYIRKLMENIDKSNTILHIISDHGTMIGDAMKNLYGRWEISNPVSIMLLPKYLSQRNIINMDILKKNQQKMVNHFDFHLFYKELMLKTIKNFNGDSNEFIEYEQSLPKLPNGDILSKSIISTEIPSDRSCIGVSNGFCFCDLFEQKPITPDLLTDDQKYIDLAIHTINNLTGNGEWYCLKLDPNDFIVSLHMVNSAGNIELVIEYKQYNLTNLEYKKLRRDNKLLSFLVYITLKKKGNKNEYFIPLENHSNGKLPKIIRIDFFKYEQCLTTDYQSYSNEFVSYNKYFATKQRFGDSVEPIFIDKDMTIKMLKQQNVWNLRVCKCFL